MSADDDCSLKKIYHNLCECCAKPKDECTRGVHGKSQGDAATTRNRFETLTLGQHDDISTSKNLRHVTRPEAEATELEDCPSDSPSPRIVNDTLGEAFELRKEIQVYLLLPAAYHKLMLYSVGDA